MKFRSSAVRPNLKAIGYGSTYTLSLAQTVTARNRWGGLRRNPRQLSGTVTAGPSRGLDSAGIHLEGPVPPWLLG